MKENRNGLHSERGTAGGNRGETGLRFEDGNWIFVQYGDVVPIDELVRCRDCGNKKTNIVGTFCTKNMAPNFDPDGYCHLAERRLP